MTAVCTTVDGEVNDDVNTTGMHCKRHMRWLIKHGKSVSEWGFHTSIPEVWQSGCFVLLMHAWRSVRTNVVKGEATSLTVIGEKA